MYLGNLIDPQTSELFFLGSPDTASPLGPLPMFSLPATQPAPAYADSSIFIVPHAGFNLTAWPFVGIKISAVNFRTVITSSFFLENLQTLWNVAPSADGSVQFVDIHGTLCLEFSDDMITSEWLRDCSHLFFQICDPNSES
jgi:hypothetical protein